MHRLYCEKEAEIVAALRSGTLGAELEEHCSACDICSGTVAVAKFLQAQSAPPPNLPDPDFLWWRARLATRQSAVERATRSIVLVRTLACSGIGAAALWLLFATGHLRSILTILSGHEIWLSSALGQTALLMSAAALVFALLSSWYLARLGS